MSVAVLLPHYKNLNGLRLTLESLVSESSLFTLFLIDDGSKLDKELEILCDGFRKHFRIELILNSKNLGITRTLNFGLKKICELNKFEFIARIDAGDRNLNERFKEQVSYMQNNPTVALLGSFVRFVNMDRQKLFDLTPATNYNQLKKDIHVYNPFIHPAVMIRTAIIENIGFYPEDYPALEDHAFFMRISKKHETAVLNKVLVEYELNPTGISLSKRSTQTKSRLKLFLDNYYFGIYPTYGLIRAFLTHLISPSILNWFKVRLYKNR
ncbi:MAG: glycosyltransferase [Reichenbachiella sp.]|uniref:glycosyltransferase n=1 Tax=Reichenbachiella sp. TaxID=2184521 RepID=UPI0032975E3B